MQSEFITILLTWVTSHPSWIAVIVFLSAAIESLTVIGVLIPGALVMFGIGALIGLGYISFLTTYWWSALGAVVGDTLSFWIGRVFQQDIRKIWPFNKYPEIINRSTAFFYKHGGKGVILGRFFGPVRGTIPTVAGMMNMSWRAFMASNIISAVCWAPIYLIPGMVFGASVEIATKIVGRLIIISLISIVFLWVILIIINYLTVIICNYATNLVNWCVSHTRNKYQTILVHNKNQLIITILFLGSLSILITFIVTFGEVQPSTIDQFTLYIITKLYNLSAYHVMTMIASISYSLVILAIGCIVGLLLLWYQIADGWYWLTVFCISTISDLLLRSIPKPFFTDVETSIYYVSPLNYVTLFGLLAIIISKYFPSWSQIICIVTTILIIVITLAQIYLGIHWLPITLGSLLLGLIWVKWLNITYVVNYQERIAWRNILLVLIIFITLVIVNINFSNFFREKFRSDPVSLITKQSRQYWAQSGWQVLQKQQLSKLISHNKAITLQWLSKKEDIIARLHAAGWELAPKPNVRNTLLCLNPQVTLQDLPILPNIHESSKNELQMVRYINQNPNKRWLLRLWDIYPSIIENTTMWVGTINQQEKWQLGFLFTIAIDNQIQVPINVILPALTGLETIIVDHEEALITLISDKINDY